MKSFFKIDTNLFYIISTCKQYFCILVSKHWDTRTVFSYLLFSFLLFANLIPIFAQKSPSYIVIDSIFAEGNKKTKLHYILRELDFESGDTIPLEKMDRRFGKSRNSLINTNLFNGVLIDTISCEDDKCDVVLFMEERWRIFPIPQVEIASQNYNVWIREQNADLRRLTYGGFINIYNLRGVGESFQGYIMRGYRNILETTYTFPYVDKKKRIGLSAKFIFRTDKQISADSRDNKIAFYPSDSIAAFTKKVLAKRWIGNLTMKRRLGINHNHFLRLRFHTMKIDQEVANFNPHYFNNGKLNQSYFALMYNYERDFRDFQSYPLTGNYFRFSIEKYGLGIFKDLNTFNATLDYSLYQNVAHRLFLAGNIKAFRSFGKEQPYFNNNQIGYSYNFIRGYEYYIVTTQQYFFFRTNLRYQFVNLHFQNPLKQVSKKGGKIIIDIYLRVFAESANVKDRFFGENNPLNNSWLFGSGVALDFILWENIPMSIEYTINREKEYGIYVHLGLLWDFWRKT